MPTCSRRTWPPRRKDRHRRRRDHGRLRHPGHGRQPPSPGPARRGAAAGPRRVLLRHLRRHVLPRQNRGGAGGGNSAAEDALTLAKLCRKVYIVHRRDALRATQSYLAPLAAAENIEILYNRRITDILGDSQVTGVALEDTISGEGSTLACDGVFVAIGRTPSTALASGQVALDESGYILAGEDTCTNLPGVFAVGDLRTKPLRQVITAAADGAVASKFAEEYLHALQR